jgi:Flavin containing amine oxidoreductase
MHINRGSGPGEASYLLQSAGSKKYKPLSFARPFGLVVLSVFVLMLLPDEGWSQPGGQVRGHRVYARAKGNSATTVLHPGAKENSAIPTIEPTSLLGQALAACDKDAAVQESFAFPDWRERWRWTDATSGHRQLICVFDALIAEAKSLGASYMPIVDAKYPDFNSVENICQIKPDTLASHMAGAEDFNNRFAVLKSKYESASKCAINIKQAFRDVVLSDMTQPPELLKSMTESIEGDVARVSDVQNQTVDLAAKVEAAKKAMKTIEKIHRAMCLKDTAADVGRADNADRAGHWIVWVASGRQARRLSFRSATMVPRLKTLKLTRRSAIAGLISTLSRPALAGIQRGPEFDVLIIGVGAAGIAAGRHLLASNKKFAILEASDRMGGRCFTDTTTLNLPYERGAFSIHLPEQSSLVKLAAQNGTELYPDPERQQFRVRSRNGLEKNLEEIHSKLELEEFYAERVRCYAAIAQGAAGKDDISCAKALPQTSATGEGSWNSYWDPIASARSWRSFPPKNTPFLLTEGPHNCVGKG